MRKMGKIRKEIRDIQREEADEGPSIVVIYVKYM